LTKEERPIKENEIDAEALTRLESHHRGSMINSHSISFILGSWRALGLFSNEFSAAS